MTKKSDAPAIRFKGFSDAWEQRKLASLCEKFTDGDWIESKDQSDFGVRLVQTGNVGVAEYLDKPNNKKWISEDTFDRLHCEEVLPGDILISRLPEPAGRACIVPLLGTKMITAVDCTIVRTAPDMSNKFLVQYLSSQAYFDDVNTCLAGGTRQRISRGNLANFNVPIPVKKSEQDAIGMFFGYLDNLITLHQRKFEKLTNVKKSMLEKMFPQNGSSYPEIRFKGFTDPWEQRKWINTVDISTNMVDPKSGKYDLLPHVAPGNIESFTGRLYDNVKLVGEENLISGKFVFNVGDIVYGKINPQLGKYVFARFSGLTSADAYVLNAKNGIVQKFLYAVIQTRDFYDYSVSVSKRSGMPKINRDELNAYSYWAPSESEQLKIGEYLLTLDHLITLHQRELKKLQNIKKSMLEKMFV